MSIRINTTECEGRKIQEFAECCESQCPFYYSIYNAVDHKYFKRCKRVNTESEKGGSK